MHLPTFSGILGASREIRPYNLETPLVRSELLSAAFEADVWIKNETVSAIGCFKLRGALVDVLRASRRRPLTELVTSSSGNHGQGVAYAGRLLDIPATVFLPVEASLVKTAMLEALGARIRRAGSDSTRTKEFAREFAQEKEAHFVDDGTSVDLSEGAGTVGFEIARDLADVDAVFVPVGDAALINGLGCAFHTMQPNACIVGVQASQAKGLAESYRVGHAVEITPLTIADGLAVRSPSPLALEGMRTFVNKFVLVDERALLGAIHTMAEAAHILAEPSGAATLAGAWHDRQNWRGKRIVLVLTGSNVTGQTLAEAFSGPPLWEIRGDRPLAATP